MTTESKQDTRPGASVLLGAAGAALVAGLVMALVALAASPTLTAVRSVAVGTLLVVAVIGFGVFVAQHGGLDHAERRRVLVAL